MQINNKSKRKENSLMILTPKGKHSEYYVRVLPDFLVGDIIEKRKNREKTGILVCYFGG